MTERMSGERRTRGTAERRGTRGGTVRPFSEVRNDRHRDEVAGEADADVVQLLGADPEPRAGRTGEWIRWSGDQSLVRENEGSTQRIFTCRRPDDVERLHEDRNQKIGQAGRHKGPAPRR